MENCSYWELKKLKFKLDSYYIAVASFDKTRNVLESLIGRQYYNTNFDNWIPNILMCTLSDEEIALIRQVDWPRAALNKNCCNGSSSETK